MKKLIEYIDTGLYASAITLLFSAGIFTSGALISHGLSLMASNSAQNTLINRAYWATQRESSIGGIFICGGGFLASAIARAVLAVDEE